MALAIVFGTATTVTVTSAVPAHADAATGQAIAAAAANEVGQHYCWDGGDTSGPTHGSGDLGNGGCGSGVVGFDCSGLALYAVYQATGIVLPHGAGMESVSGGQVISKQSDLQPGDLVFFGGGSLANFDHVGIYYGNNSSGQPSMWDANDFNVLVQSHTLAWEENALSFDGGVRYWGSSSGSGSGGGSGGGSTPSRQLIINNNTDWAEDLIGNVWTDETHTGDEAVAAAGGRMMIINNCGAVYATDSITSGVWTMETGCNAAKAIAVSANGTQMYLDYCNAVNAQTGSPSLNWTPETGCGTAQAIAIGSDGLQMLLDGCNAVWAKVGVGVGGWNSESGCGTAKAIAAGSQTIQVILNACNAVYAQNSISSNWNVEQNCGAAQAIAAGGMYQMLLNACGQVFAVNNISTVWTQETPCNAATAIAVGAQGAQLYIGGNGHAYAEVSSQLGDNWTDETPGGGTTAIAVG